MGQKANGFEFSFTEPYFMGRRISAGFDVYRKYRDSTDYASYESDTRGGALRLGLPITENLQFGVNYSAYQQEIDIPLQYRDGVAANGEASIAIKEAAGTTFTSLIGYSLVYNSLDRPNDPRKGIYARFAQELAGVGGDVNFLRTTAEARYYHEITGDFVGFVKLQGGHVASWGNKRLRVLDQFYKGPELVRGFRSNGLGPRDLASPNLDAVGGTLYYGATAEVQFPLFGLPKELGLRGALFADAGTLYNYEASRTFGNQTLNVWDDSKIRSSVGASLLWASPLGPIRFDYAYVLSSGKHDRKQAFRFSGGGSF